MKKALSILSSPWITVMLLLVFAINIGIATFIESRQSIEMAWQLVYNAKWFELILLLGVINLSLSIFQHKLYRKQKFTVFLFHVSFIIILIGAGVTRYWGFEGSMHIREGESSNLIMKKNAAPVTLPFELHLKDFIIDYYPGSQNPSGFSSIVVLNDKEKGILEEHKIYMNNILKHRGYRFYQSSYPEDQKGTILSVTKDTAGTFITYLGYLLLSIGMFFSLLNKNSRFIQLMKKNSVLVITLLLSIITFTPLSAKDTIPAIPAEQAKLFGSLLVRDEQGRTKPVNTMVEDIFRKVHRQANYMEQSAMQVLLGMFVYPEKWQNANLIYAGKKVPTLIEIDGKYASLKECYIGQGLFSSSMPAMQAYRTPPAQRSKAQNDLIRFDERLNILYQWFGGTSLNIYPNPDTNKTNWLNPINVHGQITTADSTLLYNALNLYFSEARNAMETGNWQTATEIIHAIKKYQLKYGKEIPSAKNVRLETWYYKAHIFKRISTVYLTLGLILLVIVFTKIFKPNLKANKAQNALLALIALTWIIHTIGLVIRWILSGHAPWSNAYETMIFISWSGILAGLILSKWFKAVPALAAILAWIFLFAGHMSWMDPQLTNLVPVLKSKWLVIHVAVITSSYGFLGIIALIAFVNLILMSLQSLKNYQHVQENIDLLSRIIEMGATIGLYLLTIGTFLGGVWANVSWGRYWAWDPKETWALITILVYAIVLHLRLVPGLKGKILFNFASLIAYASVMMTYFGVNYYLSGLHSYATGDPAPIPKGVYYTLGVILLVTLAAIMNTSSLKSKLKKGTGGF